MGRLARLLVISGLAGSLAVGCGAAEPTSAPPDPEPQPEKEESGEMAQEATTIFSTRCFTCHGTMGAGDGPGSAGLTPPPRNFQDPEWQSSVDDEHIGNIILYGGAAVGRSPMMPGNPDLIAKPEVVAALVEHIRTLAP